jgi:uncharacterized protein (TIGR03545 family)
MIRWSYLRPRLAIAVVLLAAVYFGLDPLMRYGFIVTGQQITTAKVEVGEVQTSMFNSEITLRDVQIADPDAPMKNLVEAKELKFSIDPNSAIRKRFVAKQVQATGLRFGADRTTSGELQNMPHPGSRLAEKLRERLSQSGETALKCLDQLADLLGKQAEKQLDTFESVQLTRELARRWPAEYQRMQASAEDLRRRAEEIRKLAEETSREKNVLRSVEDVDKTLAKTEQLRHEIDEFRGEVERLRRQVETDKAAVRTAQQHDADRIRRTLQFPRLNAEELSDYFLGPEVGERVATAARWIEWARQHMPHKVNPSGPMRMRGTDVLFAGMEKQPGFLIRSLLLDGEGQVGREQFQFTGTAEGITSQPAVYGKPTTLKAEVRGAAVMQIEATLDRTKDVARDHIVVECPGVVQPKRTLGKADRLAVSVSPGLSRISVVLDIVDNRLAGRLTLRQEPVQLVPILPPEISDRQLIADLQQAASRIQTVETTVDLSGTAEQPDWTMHSSLGSQVADAVNSLLEHEFETRREQLLARLQQQVDDEGANFDQQIAAAQNEVAKRLDLSQDELRQLTTMVASRVPLAGEATDRLQEKAKELEKKLPIKLPLRF